MVAVTGAVGTTVPASPAERVELRDHREEIGILVLLDRRARLPVDAPAAPPVPTTSTRIRSASPLHRRTRCPDAIITVLVSRSARKVPEWAVVDER
jgi:hypothetical protein